MSEIERKLIERYRDASEHTKGMVEGMLIGMNAMHDASADERKSDEKKNI